MPTISAENKQFDRNQAFRSARIGYPCGVAWLNNNLRGLLSEPFTVAAVLALAVASRMRRIGIPFGAVRPAVALIAGLDDPEATIGRDGRKLLAVNAERESVELVADASAVDGLLLLDVGAELARVRRSLGDGGE